MTRKQGVIFRLVIVLAIMLVFGGATYVVVKKFFMQNPWEKIQAAKALLAEAKEREKAGDWKTAQAKLAQATKLVEEVIAEKSPYAMEIMGDIKRFYADHYRKDPDERRQVGIYVEQALERYRSAEQLYGKGDEQRLKPALKRCKMLHYYTAMKAFGMIGSITDSVLKSVARPDEKDWLAYWAGVKSYNAWATEQKGLALLIQAKSAAEKGEVKKEQYQAIKAEYDKALKGYLEIVGLDFDRDKVKDEMPDLFKLSAGDMYMQAAQVELRISDAVFQIEMSGQPKLAAQKHNDNAEGYFAKAMKLAPENRLESYMISAVRMKSQFGRAHMENDDVEPRDLAEHVFPGLKKLAETVAGSEGSWSNTAYVFIAQANGEVAKKARARAGEARQNGYTELAGAMEEEAVAREKAAVAIYEKGRERLGNDIVLLKNYVMLLINIKRHTDARAVLDKALGDISNPQDRIMARQALVQLLLMEASEAETDEVKNAKIAEAADNLEILIKADPKSVGTHQLWGRLYMMKKEYGKAERHYKLIVGDAPAGYSALGGLYSVWSKPAKAEESYRKAAEASGYAGPGECTNLIRHYVGKNRIARAERVIALYKKAVAAAQQRPSPYILVLEAQIYSRAGRHEDAQRIFKNLMVENKHSGYGYYYALSIIQDPSAGLSALQQAEAIFGKMWSAEKIKIKEEEIEKRNVDLLCKRAVCWMRMCALKTSTREDKDNFDRVINEMESVRRDLTDKGKSYKEKYGKATAVGIKAISSTIYDIYFRSQMKNEPEAKIKIDDAAAVLDALEPDTPRYENMCNDAKLFGRPKEIRDKLKEEFLSEKTGLAETALETAKTQADREGAAEALKFWRIRYASLLEETGQRETAIKQWKLAYGENKDDYNIVYRIARFYLSGSSDDLDNAKKYIGKLDKIDSVHASTFIMKARYEARTEKDVVKRIKRLELTLAKNAIPDIYIELGNACFTAANKTGDVLMYKDAAIDAYEKARKLMPGNVNTLERLARIRLDVARMRQSNLTAARIDDLYIAPAKKNITDILAINSEHFGAESLRAEIAQFKGDPEAIAMFKDNADKLLKKLGELRKQGDKENAERIERHLYSTYLALSDAYRANKDFVAAEEFADKAKKYGSKLDADLKLKNLKLARKQYKEAVGDMEKLMADEAYANNKDDDIKLRGAYAQTLFDSIMGLQAVLAKEKPDLMRADEIRADIRAFREKFERTNEDSIRKYPDVVGFKQYRMQYLESIAMRPEEAYLLAESLRKEIMANPDFANRARALASLAGYYVIKGGDENLMIAEGLYLEALKAQPNNENFNRAIVLNLYVAHKGLFPGKALKFVDDCIADNPDKSIFVLLRAETLDRLERRYDAMQAWQTAVNRFPHIPGAYLGYIQACLRYEVDDPQKARKRLIEILADREPELDSIPLSNALGRIYYDFGNPERAMGCFNRTLKIDPENAEAMFYEARIAYDRISKGDDATDMGELKANVIAAQRAARNYLDLHGKADNPTTAAALAQVYGLMAGCEAYLGNPRKAVEYLKKAAETNLDPGAIEQMRRIYLAYDWPQLAPEERKAYSDAELYDWLKNLRGNKDKNYQVQLSMGCAAMMAEMSDAEEYLRSAVRITKIESPKLVEPHVFLDINAMNEGNYIRAEKRFAEVRRMVSSDLEQALAAVDIYVMYGRKDRAVQLLEHFIPLAKKDANASREAAVLLARLAKIRLVESETPDVAAARKLVAEALQLDSKNNEAIWMQGWIKILDAENETVGAKKQASIREGIKEIEKVAVEDRTYLVWACLARAHVALAALEDAEVAKGSYARARKAITRSLTLSPIYDLAWEMSELYERIEDK